LARLVLAVLTVYVHLLAQQLALQAVAVVVLI
jgi:hypothetical protein